MSIFNRLFGKNSNRKENQSNGEMISGDSRAQIPNEDLFIDNQHPQLNVQSLESGRHKRISEFLGKDFLATGRRDGYLNHCSEDKELAKKGIRAAYLNLSDQVMQEIEKKALELSNKLHDVQEFKNVRGQIENTLRHLADQSASLKLQKELTVESEGWLMTALYDYEKGYGQGVQDYIAEQNFLGPETIL